MTGSPEIRRQKSSITAQMTGSPEIRKQKSSVTGNLANKDDPIPSSSAGDGNRKPDLAPQNDEQEEQASKDVPTSTSANDGSKSPDVTSNSDANEGTKKPDSTPDDDEQNEEDKEKYERYLALYKATVAGNWTTAKGIFDQDPDVLTAPLYNWNRTVLHVAVSSNRAKMSFLRNLVDLMVQKSMTLGLEDDTGLTPLHYAARAGNTKAVDLLVKQDPILTGLLDNEKDAPLHLAAYFGHEETIRYLLPVTLQERPSFLAGTSGGSFLVALIMDGFFDYLLFEVLDIAIEVLEEEPRLSVEEAWNGATALYVLAQKPQAFPSGMWLTFWQHLLYHVWVQIFADRRNSFQRKDVENPAINAVESNWKILPQFQILNGYHMEKLRQKQALKLLKSLVEKASKSKQALDVLGPATRMAARNGIYEYVEEVIKAYPDIVTMASEKRNLFDEAVIYRQEKVFNLIFQLDSWKYNTMGFDSNGCTMLHHAATLNSFAKIEKIPGAALQMQRELQWYKEVEKIVLPSYRMETNKEDKTPYTVFTESHKELVNEGARWMKDTTNSYTIVAALIVTITFAAAFTVPGGNNGDTGLPIFLNKPSFMVFATTNSVALFSSTSSLLMFLGILTSRYSQEDFLRALPMRLAIGLITLFFSIASMLVAFTASIYIMLSYRVSWIAIPIGSLACIPLLLFAFLQFPLLVEVVNSTFGPSIFRKQSDDILI